jgi:transcriptional activator SPT7
MNTNIKTLKRVRRTHAKFAALNLNTEEGGMGDEPPDLGEEGMVDEVIDERPWRARYAGLRQVKGPVELEVGEKNADECLKWMNRKVLEHEGFQGSSSAALDVMVGVTSEYFLNVGRTLRFMCDKYAKSMTPEEIILHTLFESGVTRIQDLERYIKDDVVRHGSRLIDLEKKLVGAYREATQVEVLDDDALFAGEDDEEDESAFVMGGFSDSLGDDFLGLRELGIAAELGLSSLTIPKKLLKGKSRGAAGAAIEAKPKEPPPPYPPPPSLLPITSKNVGDQIGLLRPYFQMRLAALVPPGTFQGLPYLPPGPQFGLPPPPGVPPLPYVPSSSGEFTRVITIQDDAPAPAQAKLGPLGQVLKTGAAAGAVKKKNKAKEPVLMSMPDMSDAVPVEPMRAFNGLGVEGRRNRVRKGKVREGLWSFRLSLTLYSHSH